MHVLEAGFVHGAHEILSDVVPVYRKSRRISVILLAAAVTLGAVPGTLATRSCMAHPKRSFASWSHKYLAQEDATADGGVVAETVNLGYTALFLRG